MKDNLKYLIIGFSIVISVSIYVYFSPYQSCVRALKFEDEYDRGYSARICKSVKY
jgi:hypothetical protein